MRSDDHVGCSVVMCLAYEDVADAFAVVAADPVLAVEIVCDSCPSIV